MIFRSKDLWDFNSEEYRGKVEDYTISDGWEEDVRIGEHSDGGPEITSCEGKGANLAKVEVGALEWRFFGFWDGTIAHVQRFGGEEEVENELEAVCNCQNPVYPLPAMSVVGNEPHYKRTGRRSAVS